MIKTAKIVTERFQGHRLRLCRNFHGYTLNELGQNVGATRQYVHQLEVGEKSPTDEFAHALADVLEVLPVFFYKKSRRDISSESCNFRKLKTTPVRATEQVIAHGELFQELIAYMEKYVGLPPVNFPCFSATSDEEIEKAAEHSRSYWSLTLDEPISNMTRVVEGAGAVVTTFVSVSPKVDALSINSERPIIVRSVAKDSATRLRFDIAHECAHLVLHRIDAPSEIEQREYQANRFASAFLLPRRAFKNEFPMRGSRLDWKGMFSMKRDWKVSVQSILRRASDLGLINAAQYRSGNIFIAKNGYRTNEPFEPKMIENAELMKLAVNNLDMKQGRKIGHVADDLNVQPNFLRKLIGIPVRARAVSTSTVIDINDQLGWSGQRWYE